MLCISHGIHTFLYIYTHRHVYAGIIHVHTYIHIHKEKALLATVISSVFSLIFSNTQICIMYICLSHTYIHTYIHTCMHTYTAPVFKCFILLDNIATHFFILLHKSSSNIYQALIIRPVLGCKCMCKITSVARRC